MAAFSVAMPSLRRRATPSTFAYGARLALESRCRLGSRRPGLIRGPNGVGGTDCGLHAAASAYELVDELTPADVGIHNCPALLRVVLSDLGITKPNLEPRRPEF